MGLKNYKITITSAETDIEYEYTDKNVSYINISNTRERIYQTGTLILIGIPNFTIGDEVIITVNDEEVFAGNIADIKLTGTGVRNTELNLVGKSFLLTKFELNEYDMVLHNWFILTVPWGIDANNGIGKYQVASHWIEGPLQWYGKEDSVSGEGDNTFSGGFFHEDAKGSYPGFIFVPYNSSYIGIWGNVYHYNPTFSHGAAHGEGAGAFHGCVQLGSWFDEYLFVPYNSNYIGFSHYNGLTYTRGPEHGEGDGAFVGGCQNLWYYDISYLEEEDDIYTVVNSVILAPFDSDYIGICSVGFAEELTDIEYTRGPSHGEGNGAFAGIVEVGDVEHTLLENPEYDPEDPEEDVPEYLNVDCSRTYVLVPHNSEYIGLYDAIDNTYTRGPEHGEGSEAFWGGICVSQSLIVLVPYKSTYIGLYNPKTNTYRRGPQRIEDDTPLSYDCHYGLIQANNDIIMFGDCRFFHYNIIENTYSTFCYIDDAPTYKNFGGIGIPLFFDIPM